MIIFFEGIRVSTKKLFYKQVFFDGFESFTFSIQKKSPLSRVLERVQIFIYPPTFMTREK